MAQKENFKTAGLRLREHRAALGLDRDQLGARIGVSGSTIKQVELGYQALGRAASERLAQLLAPPRPGYVGEEPAHYGAGHPASDAVSAALALACEERIKSAAEGVASALGCHYREALEIVIRRELGKVEQK